MRNKFEVGDLVAVLAINAFPAIVIPKTTVASITHVFPGKSLVEVVDGIEFKVTFKKQKWIYKVEGEKLWFEEYHLRKIDDDEYDEEVGVDKCETTN